MRTSWKRITTSDIAKQKRSMRKLVLAVSVIIRGNNGANHFKESNSKIIAEAARIFFLFGMAIRFGGIKSKRLPGLAILMQALCQNQGLRG